MHEDEPRTDPSDVHWPLWKRIGFRFLAVYFLLYTLPFPLNQVPWLGGMASQAVSWFWRQSVLWTGPNVLGIEREIPIQPTGSGDTTFEYVRLFLVAVSALVLTLAWSLADRKRTSYSTAARWLVVGCRFYLGLYLLGYGLAKTIPNQFQPPSLYILLQTYGSSSPMRLAWTFMGLSPVYTIFAGLMEVIPGLLLLIRRTRLLGACLAAAVMTNVAMMNYCFDVPVKLFSSHLLAMALALVALDASRLVALFLRNRPVPAAPLPPLFVSKKLNVAAVVVGLLIVVPAIWGGIDRNIERYYSTGAGRAKPSIWGIHDVETFRLDGEEPLPLVTDETYWRALVIDRPHGLKFGSFEMPGHIRIQRLDGKLVSYPVEYDEEAKTLTLLPAGHVSLEAAREAGVETFDVLRYERPEPDRMIVRGTFQGHEVEAELRERDAEEMLLITRGYHWINEVPYNR